MIPCVFFVLFVLFRLIVMKARIKRNEQREQQHTANQEVCSVFLFGLFALNKMKHALAFHRLFSFLSLLFISFNSPHHYTR